MITIYPESFTGKVVIGMRIPTVDGADMLLKLLMPIIDSIGFHILRLSQVALIARPGRL